MMVCASRVYRNFKYALACLSVRLSSRRFVSTTATGGSARMDNSGAMMSNFPGQSSFWPAELFSPGQQHLHGPRIPGDRSGSAAGAGVQHRHVVEQALDRSHAP